ncbi:hypothetical protein ACFW9F_15060 [Streptomyces sp. NPDC059506]|uniref:hypothetical protein n=1 Tax=Streptomyces TaxID=1883 RepID=UPI00369441D4
MLIPHATLTPTQYALLEELLLAPLSHLRPEEVAARGLSTDQVPEDVPALLWLGLIERSGKTLVATARGAAYFYRSEHEKALHCLAEVAAFADVLEAEEGTALDQQRIPGALRNLAQGTWSLQQVVLNVQTTD